MYFKRMDKFTSTFTMLKSYQKESFKHDNQKDVGYFLLFIVSSLKALFSKLTVSQNQLKAINIDILHSYLLCIHYIYDEDHKIIYFSLSYP